MINKERYSFIFLAILAMLDQLIACLLCLALILHIPHYL